MIDAIQANNGSLMNTGSQSLSEDAAYINQEQFLTLLVTQLENQDPLSPMESHEFAAQMAQFSSLQSLQSIDAQIGQTLEAELLSAQVIQNTMAASLIGKEVTVAGESVTLSGGSAKLRFTLPGPVEELKITIFDESGRVVRTIVEEDQFDGNQVYIWNGNDNYGQALPDGAYQYSVSAIDADGKLHNDITTTSGIITGVNYDGGVAMLIVGDQVIPMGMVLSIRIPEE